MSMTTDKDPIELAREILEGKGKKEVEEGLKKALDSAKQDDKKEFEFEGKTYKVSDFDEMSHGMPKKKKKKEEVEESAEELKDIELDDDLASVDKANKATTQMKHDKNKPSDASAKQESVKLDIDSVVAEMVTKDESDDMVALFSGEELSEEFKTKATTIFETAVKARVKDVVAKLEEEANTKVAEITESNKEELTESLDEYLSYVVEEWVKENEIALDRGIKSDISESFMMGLKNLFEAHYIDMPDEKYDMVAELNSKVAGLESQLNEEIRKNVDYSNRLQGSYCGEIFNEMSQGLAATQVEKLRTLSEGIEFDTPQQFKEKLGIIRESYFSTKNSNDVSGEVELFEDAKPNTSYATPSMKGYAQYLDRQGKHNNY